MTGRGEAGPELAALVSGIDYWFGIVPPNASALGFAEALLGLPQAFAALPPLGIDAEPADFACALERHAEPAGQ